MPIPRLRRAAARQPEIAPAPAVDDAVSLDSASQQYISHLRARIRITNKEIAEWQRFIAERQQRLVHYEALITDRIEQQRRTNAMEN